MAETTATTTKPGASPKYGEWFQALGTTVDMFGSMLSSNETARGFKLSAREVVREGKLAAKRIREMGERVQSSQRTGYAKAGVVASGSALEVMTDTVVKAENDALETMRQAERQAKEIRRAERKAKRAGALGFAGSIAGGIIGSVYGPGGAALGAQLGGSVGTAIGGAE